MIRDITTIEDIMMTGDMMLGGTNRGDSTMIEDMKDSLQEVMTEVMIEATRGLREDMIKLKEDPNSQEADITIKDPEEEQFKTMDFDSTIEYILKRSITNKYLFSNNFSSYNFNLL